MRTHNYQTCVRAGGKWLRFRRKTLSDEERRRLPLAIDARFDLDDPDTPKHFYPFVHRVAREYKHLWSEDTKTRGKPDCYHFMRETLIATAISTIMMQVRPKTDVPYDFDDVDRATAEILPVLEQIFSMPGAESTRGTKEWIEEKLKSPSEITISDAASFPELERALIKRMILQGDANGFPVMKPELIPAPNVSYKVTPDLQLKHNKINTAPNGVLIFFRSGGHNSAMQKMQNDTTYPVIIKGENPTGAPWTNIPQVCYSTPSTLL